MVKMVHYSTFGCFIEKQNMYLLAKMGDKVSFFCLTTQ